MINLQKKLKGKSDMFNSKQTFAQFAQKREVICFGSGKFFERAYQELSSMDVSITACLDNECTKWNTEVHNIPVYGMDFLRNFQKKDIVILITNKYYYREIEEQLRLFWGDDIVIFKWPMIDVSIWTETYVKEKMFYEPCKENYEKIMEQDDVDAKMVKIKTKKLLVLPRIPVMLTERCSLQCEQCNNLMPYYCTPKDYDYLDVLKWIRTVAESVDEWISCELVGGEPFLYRNLEKILAYVLNCKKILHIEITTNGTIVPNEKILTMLVNPKLTINISNYGNIAKNDRLIKALDKKNVNYTINKDLKWIKVGGVERREREAELVISQYRNCYSAKMCKTILNGKLHVCSRAASLYELGYNRNVEYVDLVDNKSLRKDLEHFFELDRSFACNYCDNAINDIVYIEPAVQVKK